ncbi:hypothetical protein S40293_09399, partial [Stachybotrys chartarum IBT 40293]
LNTVKEIISALPASPVDLLQLFLPVSLIERWVTYTNEASELPRGPGPGSCEEGYKTKPSRPGRLGAQPLCYRDLPYHLGLYEPFVVAKQQDRAGKGWSHNTVRAVPTPEGQVNQIAWKDNALVLLLSTVFTGQEFVRRVRRRPGPSATSHSIRKSFGDAPVKELPMLAAAAAYNDQMGAVDIGDQLRATEGLDHRIRRAIYCSSEPRGPPLGPRTRSSENGGSAL